MKTLLERAKPQLLEALKKQKVQYPNLNESTEKFLRENYFCNEITWGLWVDLKSMWTEETDFFPEHPWQLFEKN